MRLGTCFSLVSYCEQLLSVQATKLRHNIFSGTNFLAIVVTCFSLLSLCEKFLFCSQQLAAKNLLFLWEFTFQSHQHRKVQIRSFCVFCVQEKTLRLCVLAFKKIYIIRRTCPKCACSRKKTEKNLQNSKIMLTFAPAIQLEQQCDNRN